MKRIQRQKQLINALNEESNYKTVRYYAEKLNVSTRTIYADLKDIEPYLLRTNTSLETKRGVGIRLKTLKNETPKYYTDSLNIVEFRKKKILEIMLFEKNLVTIQELADFFRVSKSSISTELSLIKNNFLNEKTVMILSDNNGTRLKGSEEEFQNTYVKFNELITGSNNETINYFSNTQERKDLLKGYYGKKLVDDCYEVFFDYIKNKGDIAEYYIQNLLDIFIVLAYRASKSHHICTNIKTDDESSDFLLSQLTNKTNIEFTNEDAAYLSKHMIANKINLKSIDQQTEKIVNEIISKMSQTLKVNLNSDEELKRNILAHFPPMLYRLRNNVSIHNPFTHQVKEEFGLMYNITWFVLSGFESALKVTFNENEVGFLMIYFQSSLDRLKLSKKVLIVCPTGITMSGILLNRVKNVLPPLDSIEVASFSELSDVKLDEFDFIISTAYIKINGPPVVVVSPLLNNKEMEKIMSFYNEHFITNQFEPDVIEHFQNIKRLLNIEFLEFNCQFKSSDEVINTVINQLFESGYVDKEFRASVFDRMQQGDTDLPTGVALPHGNPSYVKKSIIGIYVNENEIKWNQQYIRVVIFVCISKEDINQVKDILASIYQIVDNKKSVEKCFINTTKEKFINFIGGLSHDKQTDDTD